MSENKYHTSKNGFLTKCSASKRACPRGGVHYTQEQYDQLASENDSRIRGSVVKHDPESYYGKAEAAYVASVQRLKRFDIANEDKKAYEQKLLKEAGLTTADLSGTQEQVRKSLESALTYARDVYVEEGVSYGKASFIIQDMKANTADPTKPITKRKDRLDPDIAVKTKNAVARLNEDSKYVGLRNAYVDAARKERIAWDIGIKSAHYWQTIIRERNASGMPNLNEQKALEKAKTWLKAGIPPEAKEVYTSGLTPADVSVDKKGRINNVWVETADGIERVVSYDDSKAEMRGASGHLITETGKKVSTYTHFHSYKSDNGGIRDVIVGKKNGTSFPAEKFVLHTSWDSGD
jgi:hypothetical protein